MNSINKERWNMSKEELIKSRENYIAYFNDNSYEPSEDSLAQYEILIKLEEVKQLILNKKDKVYFSDRYGAFEKLNQIRDIIHI
jgi:hypothetical protein